MASVLTVRVHVQGQTVGALHLGRRRAGGYAATDIALAGQVAAQLSVVLAGWTLRTAQRDTVAALHQSEALTHQLLESSGDVISVLDLVGQLLFMNLRGQQAWELDERTPLRGTSWVAFWEATASAAGGAVATAAHGDSGHFEGCFRTRRTQTLTWWDVLVTPILDPQGHPDRLVAIARDITARKAAEQALQQAHDLLDQRVQERTAALHQAILARQQLEQDAQRAAHFAMLGQLAAGLAYEIRNPLGAVFLHVDVLTEELQQPSSDSPAQVAEALTEIKTQLARLDDLVQDYLSLVRLGSMVRTVQDLGAAVQAWGTEMQPALAARGSHLQMQGLARLGPVAFHPSTLRRVLVNLVQNAVDAMPQGGTVTLTGVETATHVQLLVHDTGSGITAEHLKRARMHRSFRSAFEQEDHAKSTRPRQDWFPKAYMTPRQGPHITGSGSVPSPHSQRIARGLTRGGHRVFLDEVPETTLPPEAPPPSQSTK